VKKFFFLLVSVFSVLVCNADLWTRKADFPGGPQENANGFTIGNKAYVLCHSNQIWEYSPDIDTWVQKSNTPFTSSLPIGVGIGSYGYVYSDSGNQFWRYDPIADTWARKSDLPGLYRLFPVSFVIGNKAYFGGGECYILTGTGSTILFDGGFFSYDPSTNLWDSLTSIPCVFYGASGFVANGKGYVTGILDTNSLVPTISPCVYEYDPVSNNWTQKANFPGKARTDATSFSIGNIGYFGIGDTGTGGVFKDLWQYNAYTDMWTSMDTIPCIDGKDQDASFSVNYKGYICFGSDMNPDAEIWEYTPDSVNSTHVIDENAGTIQPKLAPNPATTTFKISSQYPINQITITNLLGQIVFTKYYQKDEAEVDVSQFSNGMYFVTVNGTEISKFIKK